MKFSVIVPVYNVERFLRQCVESVLNQSCGDFELILVDDGSPDNCPRICDEYALKDGRVKVIHKTNGGAGAARIAGCKTATGDFIVCLDGDDWLSPDYLEKFSAVIDEFSPDICLCGFFNAGKNGNTPCYPVEREGFFDKNDIEKTIYPYLIEDKHSNYFSASLWAKAIKRELFVASQITVDTRIKIGEDQCVVKPCVFRAESLYVIDECLYYYRQNDESMTKSKGVFDLSVPKLIANHFEKEIGVSSFDFQAQIYRHAVHDLFNAVASQFHAKRDEKEIRRIIRQTLSDEYYKKALKESRFAFFSKGWLARKALKNKMFCLIKAYNDRR